MKNLKISLVISIFILAYSTGTLGNERQETGTKDKAGIAITVYSESTNNTNNYYNRNNRAPGFGVVKEQRAIELKKGLNTIRFQDVASLIDATSVHFKSLTDPEGTFVIEQNYEYDLANTDKILQKYIGKEIILESGEQGVIKGRLINFEPSQILLEVDDKTSPIQIIARNNLNALKFTALPENLITKPTLVWLLSSSKEGEQMAEVTYHTDGISWKADYTAVISSDDNFMDLAAWVTIENRSGVGYEDAKLKLVAGEVNKMRTAYQQEEKLGFAGEAKSPAVQGFAEQSFFEYHLYTLGRKTSISNNSIKQIELFEPVSKVPVKKLFVYNGLKGYNYHGYIQPDINFGATSNTKVDVYVELENSGKNNMGMPLPGGKVRVYKEDKKDNSKEFIGEDLIDHTPKDEKLRLMLGQAFDIKGERTQIDFKVWTRRMKETIEISVRNHKEEAVEVLVKEGMYRGVKWEILDSSHEYRKLDAFNVHFPVKVEPDGETKVKYTVEYTW